MKAINLDGHNEYNIEEVDGVYFIYYSLSEQWNLDTRGTLAFKVVNTGNGFKITQEHKGKLNYSESFLLYIIFLMPPNSEGLNGVQNFQR